jgi:hypothetical protein
MMLYVVKQGKGLFLYQGGGKKDCLANDQLKQNGDGWNPTSAGVLGYHSAAQLAYSSLGHQRHWWILLDIWYVM